MKINLLCCDKKFPHPGGWGNRSDGDFGLAVQDRVEFNVAHCNSPTRRGTTVVCVEFSHHIRMFVSHFTQICFGRSSFHFQSIELALGGRFPDFIAIFLDGTMAVVGMFIRVLLMAPGSVDGI